MPPNTVYVGRGSQWGNPFPVKLYGRKKAVGTYRAFIVELELNREICKDLRGKNLACWCRLDQCCHADVLLEIANS
jgi:hypothetical protein